MRRDLYCSPLALSTVPVVGLWLFWVVPTPLPFSPVSQGAPARAATAHVKERRSGNSEAGRALFQSRCARCHDADGKGEYLHEKNPNAPDFTNARWHQSRSSSALVVSILDGKGKQMPAFGGRLTDAEVRDIVAYIRTFSRTSPTAAEVSPDDFEARFNELEEEFERLRQQIEEVSSRRKH